MRMSASDPQQAMTVDPRYRVLLDAAVAVVEQATVQAVVHSLRRVLSSITALHGADLYLLSEDRKTLQLIAFDRVLDGPSISLGTTLPNAGIAAQVIEQQKPIYVPDISEVMRTYQALAPFAESVGARSSYLFPVSTSRKQYGVVAFTKMQGQECSPQDLELMGSLALHVAVSLETALATARAENYQRELARERDRLQLLLDINNQVISKLDVHEFFRSASALIRKHFGSDFSAFWVLEKDSRQLQQVVMDFPGGKGFLEDIVPADLSDGFYERLRTRHAETWSKFEIDQLPAHAAQTLRSEGISSVAAASLITTAGEPLGLLCVGRVKPEPYGQQDLDILSQIGIQISLALDNALAYGRLHASADRLQQERLYLESEINSEYNFEDIVGKSAALKRVLDQVAIVASTDSTVLLHGETGTGKELVARAIHNLSTRSQRTFVRLNCAAIPSGLVESELFGHEKGAFTGALAQKQGRFELANGGTLFLDEIGDISLELQPKLLRALQEQEFERLGSNRTIHVNVRLIAATHRDLPTMIRNNQFREDLYYRLNVFPIEIPPLRDRREDIPLLVHYFVSRLSRRMQKPIRTIPKRAMESLVNAPWPGNIRELENFIERCVILTQGEELKVPVPELRTSPGRTVAPKSTFEQAEREVILSALKGASGRLSGSGGAAERLGMKRTTLQNKMRKLNIRKEDYSA